MLYKCDKRTRNFGGRFYFILVFYVLFLYVIPLALVGYEMVDSQLGPSHIQRALVGLFVNCSMTLIVALGSLGFYFCILISLLLDNLLVLLGEIKCRLL